MTEYGWALGVATEAALAAGALLRAELHRPGGPRGAGEKSPADDEVELLVRRRLLAASPETWGYCGEETALDPVTATDAGAHRWLVDPNDGTRDFIRGHRGSAVSIGLVRDGIPVLGVVYAFAYPDDAGDLITWAEECGPMRRNGRPVARAPWTGTLGRYDVVLRSRAVDRRTEANEEYVAPARLRGTTGIAHRLALVAVGEAVAGFSLIMPSEWDLAGAHALLRAVGGELVDEAGKPVRYGSWTRSPAAPGACFGGDPAVAAELAKRPWRKIWESGYSESDPVFDFARPAPGRHVGDPDVLRRAQGALLGQLAGDALGSLVEFQTETAIAGRYPEGVRLLADGGTYDTIAGQPTDDSELALSLARSIVAARGYDPNAAAAAYVEWIRSGPFDVGSTTRKALTPALTQPPEVRVRGYERVRVGDEAESAPTPSHALTLTPSHGGGLAGMVPGAANRESQANGSLMRVSPLGIWGWRLPAHTIAAAARADSQLTHPNPVPVEVSAVFAVAVARAVARGGSPAEVYADTLAWAERDCRAPEVLTALRTAAQRPPPDFLRHQGWVLVALQNAFFQLLHAADLEAGVVDTIGRGGDTDTNAAIAGALLGAVWGRTAIPANWRDLVLTCRPRSGKLGVRRPRPRRFWPVDAYELAEELLLAGWNQNEAS